LQETRSPYQAIREDYVNTHKKFIAVTEKFEEESYSHLTIMQVSDMIYASVIARPITWTVKTEIHPMPNNKILAREKPSCKIPTK